MGEHTNVSSWGTGARYIMTARVKNDNDVGILPADNEGNFCSERGKVGVGRDMARPSDADDRAMPTPWVGCCGEPTFLPLFDGLDTRPVGRLLPEEGKKGELGLHRRY